MIDLDDILPSSKQRLGLLENLYSSSIVISVNGQTNNLNIIKNRWGEKKDNLTISEVIDLFANLLCQVKYNGRMTMFQEGMKQKLIEQITKTLSLKRW
jgi:hypothetical protein